jgi:serine phosphatase RsbU (regulator of sigma subunit)
MNTVFDKIFYRRMLFGALIAFLLIFSLYNSIRYFSSPTDENLFTNVPSHYYVTESFTIEQSDDAHLSSINAGDLLLYINSKPFEDITEFSEILKQIPLEKKLSLTVFRPSSGKTFTSFVTKSALPADFLREIPPAVYVISVTEGGASDRAGMKAGDLILRINNQNFEDMFDADRLLREGKAGKASRYEILRNNQILILNVVLAKFGIPLALLTSILCGLVYLGMGSFILLKRPQLKSARLLGLAFVFVSFFIMTVFAQRFEQNLYSFLRGSMIGITFFFGAAFWFNSSFYFPKEHNAITLKKWIFRTNYVLAGLSFLVQAIIIMYFDALSVFPYGIAAIIPFNLFVHFKYRKLKKKEHKPLRKVISRTSAVAGILTFLLAMYFIRNQQFNSIGFIGIPLILIPLSYLHTIAHHGLLDISIRVRRNVQYVFVSIVWGILLTAFLLVFIYFLSDLDFSLPQVELSSSFIAVMEDQASQNENRIASRIILMLGVIIGSFSIVKLGKGGQKWINRKFYRSKYDYRQSAAELAEVMATNLNLYDLSRAMAKKIGELMHLKQAGVLFFKDEKICCSQAIHGTESNNWVNFCISSQIEVSDAIKKFNESINIDYLPPRVKENFYKNGFIFVIPIRSKEKLVGAILVGEKLSESIYHKEDLDFLSSVAKQASVAIENAFLHEELTDKERLKHELNIAREIQMASLPQETPQIPGLDIAGLSIPAMEVGGDYFDYLNGSSDKLTVIVGDVSGKGTSAALYMSKMQGILRSLSTFDLKPRELFIRANTVLYSDIERKSFITAIGAAFDVQNKIIYLARAGHLPLYHFQAESGTVALITPGGLGLGMEKTNMFANELEEVVLKANKDDVFLFATDGMTESFSDEGVEFGEKKLVDLLRRFSHEKAQDIVQKSVDEIFRFAGNDSQHDDITLVVVKIL